MFTLPSLVALPSATAITTHWSAVLRSWIIQVTVMSYSSLITLDELSEDVVLVTEGAIEWYKENKIR